MKCYQEVSCPDCSSNKIMKSGRSANGTQQIILLLMFNRNETTGYVFSVKYGGLKNKGEWLLGYYYAHIEKYAVVPYFAQYDWLRWGSSTQTKSSNFKGHEFRAAYAFGPKFNLVARLYLVNGITPESTSANSKEDGNRFRLDLNIGF